MIDKDPKGLNVRSEPGSNEKIIGNLPTQTVGVMVDITACQGKWVQITNAISDGGNKVEFQGKGWVYASLLGAATTEHETNGTSLHAKADKNSKILSKLPPNRTVKLLGGSGTWMEVEYEGVRGWLAQDDYCPNPWTSCS
jgi:SH3-like domain-containing protein